MGHVGVKGLNRATTGLSFNDCNRGPCSICARANIKKTTFPQKSNRRATKILERIHCDVAGPFPMGYGNFKWIIIFVDCYSRYISLYLMKTRDEAPERFSEFKLQAERFSGMTLKILHVDNAPELTRGRMESICKEEGITYEKTIPDSPAQNGVAERHIQSISFMSRAMLLDADMADWFWPFAYLTAVHLKNRIPHSALPLDTTPFERWAGHKPDLSHIRLFGSPITTRILSDLPNKLSPRGESGRFVGYAPNAKGYLVWIPSKDGGGTVRPRRDVIFHDMPNVPSSGQVVEDLRPLWEDTTGGSGCAM